MDERHQSHLERIIVRLNSFLLKWSRSCPLLLIFPSLGKYSNSNILTSALAYTVVSSSTHFNPLITINSLMLKCYKQLLSFNPQLSFLSRNNFPQQHTMYKLILNLKRWKIQEVARTSIMELLQLCISQVFSQNTDNVGLDMETNHGAKIFTGCPTCMSKKKKE